MTSIALSGAAVVTAAVFFFVSPALAAPDLEVRDAWVRATVPGQPVAGAYLTLKSRLPQRLISARSEVARVVEIHQMSLNDGVMRMRRIASLDLPADHEIKLAPGGIHLMLIDIQRPLLAGGQIELDLVTTDGGDVLKTTRVTIPVRKEPSR